VVVTQLEQLAEFVQHYLRRLDTLLDVSRIASGNLRLSLVEMDLAKLIRQTAEDMRPFARHHDCEVLVDCAPEIVGFWDPLAMEQVVQNLLSNAVKYGHGKPVFVAAARRSGHAVIVVRDQGIGIPPTERQRIFDRFARGPQTEASGFGIGLWVSRRLTEAMGGEISVESKVGQGAAFTLSVPIAPDWHRQKE
jgi:signal transduction histidine kinase